MHSPAKNTNTCGVDSSNHVWQFV